MSLMGWISESLKRSEVNIVEGKGLKIHGCGKEHLFNLSKWTGHSIKQLRCPGVCPHVCTRVCLCTRVCAFVCMNYFTVRWAPSQLVARQLDPLQFSLWGLLGMSTSTQAFSQVAAFRNSRAGSGSVRTLHSQVTLLFPKSCVLLAFCCKSNYLVWNSMKRESRRYYAQERKFKNKV